MQNDEPRASRMLAECNRKNGKKEGARGDGFYSAKLVKRKGGGGEREEKGRRIYAERKLAEGFHADEVNPMAAAVMCCCVPATHCLQTVGELL
jgi:hypothetical protein